MPQKRHGTRTLRNDEAHILQLIQEIYGSQNQPSECFSTDQDEIVIFVKDQRDQSPIMVNLTFVADIAENRISPTRPLKTNG